RSGVAAGSRTCETNHNAASRVTGNFSMDFSGGEVFTLAAKEVQDLDNVAGSGSCGGSSDRTFIG
ncbi:MAG: hypothetical protein EB012_10560, partial [Gammaproteobacteria bacterium]|nr:hypothetical protein [Gammaproteobacteria bacterium]